MFYAECFKDAFSLFLYSESYGCIWPSHRKAINNINKGVKDMNYNMWATRLQFYSMLLIILASLFQLTSLKDVESTQSDLERRSTEAKLEYLWNYITLDSEEKKEKYKAQVQSFFVNSDSLAEIHEEEVSSYHLLYSIIYIASASMALFAFLFEHKTKGLTMSSKGSRR